MLKIHVKNDQSHLALGGIAANILFRGRGSGMGSAMVPLDGALLSSYRLSIVSFLVTIRLGIPTPIYPDLPVGEPGLCLIQCYLGPHECPWQMASNSVQRL